MDRAFYIGYSCDELIRFRSSSGGIGTTIIKYLLSMQDYGTALTFYFNKDKCMYEPKLIYSYEEYNNCGSIYQDVNVVRFVSENIDKIKKGIVITCMPCQVKAIRNIFKKRNVKCFIISFCCSGQTTVQGTWCYYRLLGIRKEDVINIQYRGNGWPSGIQIELRNGDKIKKDNYTYPWTLMHRSLLFRPQRCYYCNEDISYNADVSLADPWLKEYKDNDRIGNTLFVVNTEIGDKCISELINCKKISCTESFYEKYYMANGHTTRYKAGSSQRKLQNKLLKILASNSKYCDFVSSNSRRLRFHINWILYIISKINALSCKWK